MDKIRIAEPPDLSKPPRGAERVAWIETLVEVFDPFRRVPVPLVPNVMQRDILQTLSDFEITLKSRRAGLTTIYVADTWLDILTIPGTKAELFAHDQDTAESIFDQIVRFQYKRLPDWIRPRATTDNVRELKFLDLDSSFRVLTAGQSEDVASKKGQARVITNLLMTEFAFYSYAEDLFSKVVNCVPSVGGKIRIDSTPNGQNSFYDRFSAARAAGERGRWRARFFPWWFDLRNRAALDPGEVIEPTPQEIDQVARAVAEYGNPAADAALPSIGLAPAQLKFRRQKIDNLRPKGNLTARDVFVVEYPEDEQSCFLHSGRPLFMAADLVIRTAARPAITGHWHSIGHDSSTGDASGHPAGTVVLDLETGEQVFEWRGWEPTDSQAERLVALQRDYPGVIVCERNYPGDSVLTLLRRWSTQNVYKHRDRELREQVAGKDWNRKPGFPMSDLTKPRAFTELEEAIRKRHVLICGRKTVDDLKGYRYNDADRIEFQGSAADFAISGERSHGELGIALALAWWGRKSGSIGVG
jgi:hypothetical protein